MASIDLTHADDVPPGAYAVPADRVAVESRRFFSLYLLCLVLISVPIKNFAYVVPPLYFFFEILAGDRSVRRIVLLGSAAAAVSCVSLMFDAVAGQAVNVPGLWLALATMLPLFIFFGMRFDRQLDRPTFDRMILVTAWFVIVQSLIGAAQFALSRNGDAVAGTFGLLDFYLSSISIAQVYFTFTLFGMILFLLLDSQRLLTRVAIACGLFTCAVAQSGHQTIFFVAALGLVSMLQLKRLRTLVQGIVLVAFVTALVVQIYPETLTLTAEWYRKVVENPRSAKRLVVNDSLEYLARPKNALLGLGMGQYSSRAALISSNEYLNRPLPDLLAGKSAYFSDSMRPAMVLFDEVGEGSAISKPYFAMLTLAAEFGLVLAIVCAAGMAWHLGHNLQLMRSASPLAARVGMASVAGLSFFVLCCFIENYMEFPQAIFIPLLLYIAAHARVCHELGQSEAATAAAPKRDPGAPPAW